MTRLTSLHAQADPQETARRMADKLAREFRPERIYLFGSAARGLTDESSDVDLLVVVRDVQDRRSLRVAMRRLLNGMGMPKDIVLLTTEEFEAKSRIPGSIAYPAATEGILLYAR